jgi:hypothetical protein
VFAAFAPVLRPLAAEVVMCWRSLDIGLPSEDAPWPRRHIFAVVGAQAVIAVRPWYAQPHGDRGRAGDRRRSHRCGPRQ